jgi:hypothetical protein
LKNSTEKKKEATEFLNFEKGKIEEELLKGEVLGNRSSYNYENDVFLQNQRLSALTRGSSENNPEKMIKNVRLDIENLKKRIKDNFTH